ncbi:MAG: hypothetical protein ACU4EQ_02535 [Candidatus Nitrosoglobus sp.]|jgi:hypothetical protein
MNVKQTPTERNPGVIFLSLLLAVASSTSLAGYFYTIAGFKKLPFEQQAMIDSLAWSDIGLTLFINIAVFIAALLLYLHRRLAFYFFFSAFVAALVKFGWAAFDEGSLGAIFSSEATAGILVLALLAAICAYTWRLDRSGVLN